MKLAIKPHASEKPEFFSCVKVIGSERSAEPCRTGGIRKEHFAHGIG